MAMPKFTEESRLELLAELYDSVQKRCHVLGATVDALQIQNAQLRADNHQLNKALSEMTLRCRRLNGGEN